MPRPLTQVCHGDCRGGGRLRQIGEQGERHARQRPFSRRFWKRRVARRSALIAVSKMATALSSELQAHAKLQSAAAATLASQAADAKAAAQRHSAARATRAREEQHAEEAHTRAQAKLREMNKALAEDQPRGPSIQASSSSTATDATTIPQPPQQDPWLRVRCRRLRQESAYGAHCTRRRT